MFAALKLLKLFKRFQPRAIRFSDENCSLWQKTAVLFCKFQLESERILKDRKVVADTLTFFFIFLITL